MKNTFRFLTLILCLSLLAGVFSACGSAPEPASAPAAESAAAAEEAAAPAEDVPEEAAAPADTVSAEEPAGSAEEPPAEEADGPAWPDFPLGNMEVPLVDEEVEVTIWMGVNPNVLKITEDIGNDCVLWNELAERTGIRLVWTVVNPDSEGEKFNLMVASDDLTDIISNATTLYSGGGEAAITDEVLIDTLPYLTPEITPQICKLMDKYPDAVPDGLTDSGWLPGFPQLSMQTEGSTSFGWQIRQDWLDDLGLEAPETYDELHDVLKAFKDEKGADAALILNYASTGMNNALVQGYGVNGMVADAAMAEPFYQVDDVVMYGPIQPEFKEYLQMIHDWYAEGLIWQDYMSATDFQNPPADVVLADRTGVFHGEVIYMASFQNQSSDPNFRLVAIPDFVKNKGDLIPFSDERSYAVSTPWSISTQCDDPELLMRWCNYLYTDEGALLANYGIEGESFNWGEDGTPVFTDLVLNNPDMNTTVALFMYCMDRGPFYRDEVREQSGYTPDQKAASEIWMSNLTTGRTLGTARLNADETDISNQIYPDIKTYIEENVLKFVTGQRDLSEFDAYVKDIEDMGIDQITELYQDAYERFLNGEVVEMGGPMGPPPPGAPPPP